MVDFVKCKKPKGGKMKRVISLMALILINANAWNIGNLATGQINSYIVGNDGTNIR